MSLSSNHEPTDEQEGKLHLSCSDWALVTRKEALLSHPSLGVVLKPIEVSDSTPLWKDDFSNLVRVLKQPGRELGGVPLLARRAIPDETGHWREVSSIR